MNAMKMTSIGAVALLAGLTLSFAPAPGGSASLGTVVSHEFSSPLVGGMGVRSLSELHGKPVLVEFWGTR